MNMNPRVIFIEGANGAGKSHLAKTLAKILGPRARVFHFPRYFGIFGDAIKQRLFENRNATEVEKRNDHDLDFMMGANHLAGYFEIECFLKQNPKNIAILDRSFISYMAYSNSQWPLEMSVFLHKPKVIIHLASGSVDKKYNSDVDADYLRIKNAIYNYKRTFSREWRTLLVRYRAGSLFISGSLFFFEEDGNIVGEKEGDDSEGYESGEESSPTNTDAGMLDKIKGTIRSFWKVLTSAMFQEKKEPEWSIAAIQECLGDDPDSLDRNYAYYLLLLDVVNSFNK